MKQWNEFLRDNSYVDENYEPLVSSDDTSESEYEENEHNAGSEDEDINISQQPSATKEKNISWCEIEQEPPQFNFVEDCGLQFDSRNLIIKNLVDLFIPQEFFGSPCNAD
ncbi:hypothetical protein NQ314_010027 [Rhamnusium bicolor]|uniref:PiggyBac transposable element-derived protein domain-containing protein n=1 Tax=Rhamnusium bicolor TaxID=1586634 RepID=A0AAV8XV45_9CUCU|nr:hypothetical protein NQ314_010027 [Rhamnusium bicolor]